MPENRYDRHGQKWCLKSQAPLRQNYEIGSKPQVSEFWSERSLALTGFGNRCLADPRNRCFQDPKTTPVLGSFSEVSETRFPRVPKRGSKSEGPPGGCSEALSGLPQKVAPGGGPRGVESGSFPRSRKTRIPPIPRFRAKPCI